MKTKDVNLLTWILVSIIIIGFFLLLNSKAFGQEWTAEQKEVWEVVKADIELSKHGDIEGILASRHNDILSLWSSKPIPFDKELLRFNLENWFNYDKPVNWELNPLAIKVIANVAIVFYSYKFSGNTIFRHSRTMETWIKQDNQWLMIGSLDASCDELPPCK